MNQYEYRLTHKTLNKADTVYATARTADIARKCLAEFYTEYNVSESPLNIFDAHRVYGEMDCSECG